jgi:hypothetical protein
MKTQKKSTNQASSNTKQPAKTLSKKDQKSTNGGGILGDDGSSSLTSSLGVNLHSSHTDEDGQTESNSFGGNIGSGTQSMNND